MQTVRLGERFGAVLVPSANGYMAKETQLLAVFETAPTCALAVCWSRYPTITPRRSKHNVGSRHMRNFTILYDEPQEAEWFRSLNTSLADAKEVSITDARLWPSIQNVLMYDRPDIVLLDGETPVLVVEETVE